MNNNNNIGVIGAGSMGMAIALNLQDKGYQVAIRDIRPDIETIARQNGLTVRSSPSAIAAHADFIIIMVVNAKQTTDVLFGDHGIASANGSGKTVLLCPTIAPEDTETIAQKLIATGFDVLDGPVSGGPVRARNGTMSLMLAGDAQVIDRHAAVLNAMSSRLFRLGERIGDGARYKLVNNLVAGMNLIASSSAVALGMRMGLDPHTLVSLMSASSGQSMMLDDRLTRAIANDYVPRAYAYILTKDVALGLDMAESARFDMPMARHALDIFTATLALGYGELDDAAVLKTLLE